MKFYYVLVFLIGLAISQIHGNNAIDFTVEDIHGKKHTLYEYLEGGKHVVLSFNFYEIFE